jgi:sugar phosphate isomerase/epimerase
VHLKDVRTVGVHDTCALGDGIVPVQRCVEVLRAAGYAGAYSVEHEPESYDPTEEVAISAARLRAWLEA